MLYNTIPVAKYTWRRPHVDLIDRSSTMDFDADNCDVNWAQYDIIIPYGSVQFMRNLLDTSLRDRVYYDRGGLWRTDEWIKRFGSIALNSGGWSTRADQVSAQLQVGPYHVRPSHEDKAFNGKVYTNDCWERMVSLRDVPPDMEVFISPVEQIVAEYRCWVIGGEVIEISRYLTRGELDLGRITSPEHHIWLAAQSIADVFLPEDIVVMDVVELEDGTVKFLEFNSFHSSGWYAADIDHVLDSVINYMACGPIEKSK